LWTDRCPLAKKIYRAEKEQLKKQKEEAAKEWEDKKRRLKLERQIAKEETRRRFASGTGLHHLSYEHHFRLSMFY
jgi:hypothetical protein